MSRRRSSARSPVAGAWCTSRSVFAGNRTRDAPKGLPRVRDAVPHALLLDLDGTLMDTLETIVQAMNAACDDLGVSPPFRAEELRPTIGMPVPRELQLLRGIVGPIADEFTDRYYAHFSRAVEHGVRLYPEVMETFPFFAGRQIASMSTRRAYQVDHMLRATGMKTVAALYGYGDPVAVTDAAPDATIRRFSELASVVRTLER